MIYRFRIIFDSEEDVFRDIEIEASATFEDLHNVILQSFGLEGQEMASFYLSDEQWGQGEEIALFDMGDIPGQTLLMQDYALESFLNREQTRMIYIYDFLHMWTFLVELADIASPVDGQSYPNLMFSHGQLPTEAPERTFESDPTESDYDYDPLDDNDLEGLDFDDNWN
jgi:hypothetical protein